MKRPWLLFGGVLLLFGVAEQCGDSRLKDAAAQAQARADSLANDREQAEQIAALLAAKHAQLADQLNRAHEQLETVRAEARQNVAVARLAASDASTELRETLDNLGASTAQLDTLEAAHATEVAALNLNISALETENRMLWSKVQLADSLLAVKVQINAQLRQEVSALRVSTDLYRRAASPSFLSRLKKDVEVAAIGVVVGVVGWELAR